MINVFTCREKTMSPRLLGIFPSRYHPTYTTVLGYFVLKTELSILYLSRWLNCSLPRTSTMPTINEYFPFSLKIFEISNQCFATWGNVFLHVLHIARMTLFTAALYLFISFGLQCSIFSF